MKRILIILGLFILVLNSYSQTYEIERDIVKAKEELYVRDTTITDLIIEHAPSGTARDAGSGLSLDGNAIDLGGTLTKDAEILGAGSNVDLGTTPSKVGFFNVKASNDISIASDDLINLGAESKVWVISGDYVINSTNGDTLGTLDDIRDLISENAAVLPFNFDYNFSSSIVDSRPGIGFFRFNNATLANVTEIYIDYFDSDGVSKNNWLSVADTGSYFTVQTDDNNYAIYELTGLLVDNGNYFAYNVTYSSHNGVISSLNTIDLELNNTTGSGGGGTAISEHAYFDTISSYNTSIVYFDSTVVVEDSLFANTVIIADKHTISDNGGLYIQDQTQNSFAYLTSTDASIGFSSSSSVQTYSNTVELRNSGTNKIIFTGDTAFMDGTDNSSEVVIKVAAISVGGSAVADTTYSSAYVMKNTEVESLQFSTDVNISTHSEGRISYDSARKQLVLDDDIDGKWNISAEVGDRFFNPTGSQIDNGKIVRITGDTVFDGYHYSKVELAGISSDDSILVLGAATTDLPSLGYGRVTFLGRLNDLNSTGITGLTYLGFAGNRIDTSPPPPYFSVCIGQTPYEDNDSGYMYFNPQMPEYNPSPHFQTDTSDLNQDVTIVSTNVYEYLPIGSGHIFDNYGFTVVGDSVQAQVAGHYTFVLSLSFEGNPTSETWNYGIFINGVLQHKKTRTTASSSAGDANVPISRELNAGDWVSTKIRNTSGTGDPTIVDLSVEIIFLHTD